MNGKPIQRNEDGLIENICIECGKIRFSRRNRLKPRCKNCGIRNSFRSRPAVGLKIIDNVDEIIKEYKSGFSLKSLGEQYGLSAMTIRAKILANGEKTRNYSESSKQTQTILKAHVRIREMCKTGEFQRNRSAMLQGIPIEEWKGFVTPINKQFYKTPEYKEWQQSVFKRDNNTCQLCSKRGCPIAAHHIYMKAKYPDKILDVDNGITLCNKCHHKTMGHEDEYIDQFNSLLVGDLCGKKQ